MIDLADGRADHRAIEIMTLSSVRRIACMLDLDPMLIDDGDSLPVGWHFIAMPASTRRNELRDDGFPGLGAVIPDLGLPRLLLAGRTVSYHSDLRVGEAVERRSWIESINDKTADARPMALVKIAHELRSMTSGKTAVAETQTYILLPASVYQASPAAKIAINASVVRTVVPDDTLLFQYSALGFNSHKIHLDRAFAREIEGFPDLVVNGGLTTLLLSEFVRLDLGLTLRALTVRNIAPLFCDRPLTIAADRRGNKWQLSIHNETGHIAAEVGVETE